MQLETRTYGISFNDLDNLAHNLGKLLSISLENRESLFLGGEYYTSPSSESEMVRLYHNFNYYDEEWEEPDYQQYPLLLYIIRSERQEEIELLLRAEWGNDLVLIRTEMQDLHFRQKL